MFFLTHNILNKCKRIEKLSVLRFQKQKQFKIKPQKKESEVVHTENIPDDDLDENVFEISEEIAPEINAKKILNNLNISGTGRKRRHKPKIEALACVSVPQIIKQTDIPCFDYLIKSKNRHTRNSTHPVKGYDSDFINFKAVVQELRKYKPMREEIIPTNFSEHIKIQKTLKVSVEKSPGMFSLNKVIDTPSRENCATNSSFNEEDLDFNQVLNDRINNCTISQESTSEEHFDKPCPSLGLIRQITNKKSELLTCSKVIDYSDYSERYKTTRNKSSAKFNFQNAVENLTDKKAENPYKNIALEEFEKNIEALNENELTVEMQPSMPKYMIQSSKSTANLQSKNSKFDENDKTIDLRSKINHRIFRKDKEINRRTFKKSMTNTKSVSNLLSTDVKGNPYQLLIPQKCTTKPLSDKYREISCITSLNKILTHIDLNIMEAKGNVSIPVVDMISMLRRRQELQKLPKSVIEYLKEQIKLKRYRIDRKKCKYSFRPQNLIFEYLMQELKLSAAQCGGAKTSDAKKSRPSRVFGPKSIQFGCYKVNPLL
ncbi:unnamed protein product [Moneuplotes crassus]|uniref:Uncharacterized protein n=1 Tax=Euplotes crassus TaxID=5936 RepID=A0AAD1X1A4_EUPCR|nr:unnamed protein product [Moneuplotes crassus]